MKRVGKGFIVTLDVRDTRPTDDEIREAAGQNPLVRKAWCMAMNGNVWTKVGKTLEV